MKYIKEAWKGIFMILVLFGLNIAIWQMATPIFPQPAESVLAQTLGASILLGFTLVFFLSTRNTSVTKLFKGLENVYFTHRWLAGIVLVLLVLHTQTASFIIQFYRDVPINAAAMGIYARNVFIVLIVFAVIAKYMKYEHWTMIHRLMIIPYLLAIYHAVFISSFELRSFSVLGIWMTLVFITGIISSLYMVLIYRKIAFKYKGTIQSIQHLNNSVTEITIKLDRSYDFKHGQFTFIKIPKSPFNAVPHPFSLSGGTGKDDVIFTIKALGDFTADIKKTIHVNDQILLTKPYGNMTFKDYPSTQVWIAGGIGITPFLSHLRGLNKPQENITLYYTVTSKTEAVHLEYLKSLDKKWPNFTLKFFESDKTGFLSLKDIDLSHHPYVFMCGPIPMAKAFKKEFRNSKAHLGLVYEAFSFTGTLVEDIVSYLKRLNHKIKRLKNKKAS